MGVTKSALRAPRKKRPGARRGGRAAKKGREPLAAKSAALSRNYSSRSNKRRYNYAQGEGALITRARACEPRRRAITKLASAPGFSRVTTSIVSSHLPMRASPLCAARRSHAADHARPPPRALGWSHYFVSEKSDESSSLQFAG